MVIQCKYDRYNINVYLILYMNATIQLPVSIGELWDKFTILLIKRKRITNRDKKAHVEYELGQLQPIMTQFGHYEAHSAFIDLLHTNESLWDIEDNIRVKEAEGVFDQTFIDLARQVYYTNDERASIKKQINVEFKSAIHEVKDYVDYCQS